MFLILIVFLIQVSADHFAAKDCKDPPHTKTYDEYQGKLSELIQADTFGGNFPNKCDDLGKNYRPAYIKILKDNNIQCSGKWCIDGEWKCNRTNQCYQVEHIVDKANTPYDNCNPFILGNLIMTYGQWNNEIGQKCWDQVLQEKLEVYGKEIFCNAIKNVVECSNCSISLPLECLDTTSYANTGIIIALVILLLCAVLTCLGIKYERCIGDYISTNINKYRRVDTFEDTTHI